MPLRGCTARSYSGPRCAPKCRSTSARFFAFLGRDQDKESDLHRNAWGLTSAEQRGRLLEQTQQGSIRRTLTSWLIRIRTELIVFEHGRFGGPEAGSANGIRA